MSKRRYKCTWWEECESDVLTMGVRRKQYKNLQTGELANVIDLPFGALFELKDGPVQGYDDKCILCKVPVHGSTGFTLWYIDGMASNCTRKEDTAHRCWVRHGTVGEVVTVDKNGNTCSAGAGSIDLPGFHGFLHNGELYEI